MNQNIRIKINAMVRADSVRSILDSIEKNGVVESWSCSGTRSKPTPAFVKQEELEFGNDG